MNDYSVNALLDDMNSVPAEEYLIGAALNDTFVIDEYSRNISPEAFSNRTFGSLWKCLCELRTSDKPANLSGLVMEYPDITDRIDTDRLMQFMNGYMGPSLVSWHAEKLMEIHARRKIVQAAAQLQSYARDTSNSVDELKAEYERIAMRFSEISTNSGLQAGLDTTIPWMSGVETRFKNLNSAYGMMTGWTDLDKVTLGWQRKDLIIVGGRTSVGKTAFSIENLIRIERSGFKVAMFSLEMSAEQVRNRIAGNLGQVRLSFIRTGSMKQQEFDSVTDSRLVDVISRIAIDDSRGVSVDYVIAEMKRWKRTNGLDFVVVDYLQELHEPPKPNDNSGSALGRIVRKLRKAAMECDCAVMALSQLNREADGKPQLSHLSGSSGIESAADVVILLHRDKENDPKTLDVHIAKQRNGPTAEVELYYDPALQKIENRTHRKEAG